jgi:hypothetical protein
LNELVLGVQGVAAFSYIVVKYVNENSFWSIIITFLRHHINGALSKKKIIRNIIQLIFNEILLKDKT